MHWLISVFPWHISMRLSVLLISFVVVGAKTVFTQEAPPRLKLTYYTQSDGLSNNHVNCMLQDHLDFLWIGTNDGLNRFDGVDFDVYRKKAGDTLSLSSNHIVSLAEDPYERLWIGTSSGLCWMDLKTHIIRRFADPVIDGKTIFSLCVVNENTILAGSHEYLHSISLRDLINTSIPITHKPKPPNQPRAYSILVLNAQKVLSAGWDGIFEIDLEHGTSEHILKTSATILSIESYNDSLVWVSTWGEGAFLFNLSRRSKGRHLEFGYPWEKFDEYSIVTDMQPMDLPFGRRCLLVSGTFGIMIADPNTVQCRMIYNYHTGHWKSDTYDAFSKKFLSANNGIVWIASDFGLAKMEVRSQKLGEYAIEVPTAAPMHVAKVHRDSEVCDSLWLALYAGGLVLYDLNKQEIVKRYKPTGAIPNFFDAYLTDCQKDGDRGFWIRNAPGDLYYFSRKTSSFSRVDHQQTQDKTGRMLLHGNRVWNQMDSSLCLMDGKLRHCEQSFSLDSATSTWLSQHRIQKLLLDYSGKLWVIGHYGGCKVYDSKVGRFEAVAILDADGNEYADLEGPELFQDSKGQIWLSHRYSLTLFHDGKFQPVSADIPALISGLCLDKEDVFWMITGNQMVTFDSRTLDVQRYTEEDGLLKEDAVTIGSIEGMNQIYIGYNGRILLFDRDALGPRDNDEPIRLTGFRVLDSDRNLLAEQDQNIHLLFQENDLRFDFRYLNFGGNERTTYSFTLDGAEDTWNEAGNSNFAIYTNLREGRYKFWVRATNASGIMTQPFMLADFTIATPYWRSWWFRLGCVVVFAGLLISLYRYRVNQLKSLMRMRAKLSADLHDELGGGLTSIRVYSEMARKHNDPDRAKQALDKIEETAAEMVQSISDIVWAINPKYDQFTYVLQRMESFASSYLGMHGIQYTVTLGKGTEYYRLSVQKRKDLLLIFKQLVVNAAKHSGCKKVEITFEHVSGKFRMRLSDDGLPMGSDVQLNGLVGIDSYVSETGGSILVKTGDDGGTHVEVEMP